MNQILFTNQYTGLPLEIVQKSIPSGFQVDFLKTQSEEALWNQIHEVDYLLAGGRVSISENVLKNADRLKMIQRSGVGLDSIDLEAVKEKRIPLYVNQGINADSVAEYTLLLILASLRKLPIIDKNTKNGIWKKQQQGVQTRELRGKTIGIIGMGHIARRLVELLTPFHVKILYYDVTRIPTTDEESHHIQYMELDDLLSQSDIISIHCPLTKQTNHLICKKSISKMKKGAVLVNTARGGIIDTDDLYQALQDGDIAYAALDVHETEPFDDSYPLKGLPNVILSPHIAGVTYDSFERMIKQAFHNIMCFDKGNLSEIEQYRYI